MSSTVTGVCKYCMAKAVFISNGRLCGTHYRRQLNGKELLAPIRGRSIKKCDVGGCERTVSVARYCRFHQKRKRSGTPLSACKHFHPKTMNGGKCVVEGCNRVATVAALCRAHYHRKRKGIPFNQKIRGVNGTGHTAKNGYRYLAGKLEHRGVMERKLGRLLLSTEEVHHKNGQRADNAPLNLELWSTSQPPGQRAKDKLAWAREIISLYEPIEDLL